MKKSPETNVGKSLAAIEAYVGGRKILAEKLDVHYQTISNWVHSESIPASYIKPLVRLSGNRFHAEDLLSDGLQ